MYYNYIVREALFERNDFPQRTLSQRRREPTSPSQIELPGALRYL